MTFWEAQNLFVVSFDKNDLLPLARKTSSWRKRLYFYIQLIYKYFLNVPTKQTHCFFL
jgi:hypothetical protein